MAGLHAAPHDVTYRMSNLERNAPIPLFQRLCAPDSEGGNASSFDAAGLQASLVHELSRLLNTRCGLTLAQFLDSEGGVLHYGMPDFSSLSSRSTQDLDLLGRVIQHAIMLFEPRLLHTEVRAVPGTQVGFASVHIAGAVRLGLMLRRVDFDMPLGLSDGMQGTV